MGRIEDKAYLRRKARENRRRLYDAANRLPAVKHPSSRIVAHFPDAATVPPGSAVALYWPYQTELDVRPLMEHLVDRGALVVLPVVVAPDAPLTFRLWTPEAPMSPGDHGIPIPHSEQPTHRPDVLVTPLLAVDRQGYRLGYGGGYYDRTLAKLRAGPDKAPFVIGAGFAGQRVDALPRDSYDQPVDAVLTENGLDPVTDD